MMKGGAVLKKVNRGIAGLKLSATSSLLVILTAGTLGCGNQYTEVITVTEPAPPAVTQTATGPAPAPAATATSDNYGASTDISSSTGLNADYDTGSQSNQVGLESGTYDDDANIGDQSSDVGYSEQVIYYDEATGAEVDPSQVFIGEDGGTYYIPQQ